MFQISEVLKKVPFFRTLGKDGIDFIVERLKFRAFEENEVIVKVGDPGDKMYIIINGKVKVVVYPEDTKEEQVIAYLGSGDYFGEMSLLTGEPRSASVITTEPSEMFILHKADFDVIVERFPSITLSMGKIMSQRLRDTLQKAAQASQKGASGAPAVKGSLKDKKLVDVLKFCENNSLNGKVIVRSGEEEGEFHYEKGVLQKVVLGDLSEDEALDRMLNWEEGEFIIKPRPIELDNVEPLVEPEEGVRLLIVNNSMVVQKMLQRAFESMGYEVYTVENAAKGKKLVASLKPQLIISDTKLPDGSGADFARMVREISSVPVVLLTDDRSKAQFEAELTGVPNMHFTQTHEVGEIVKIAEQVIK